MQIGSRKIFSQCYNTFTNNPHSYELGDSGSQPAACQYLCGTCINSQQLLTRCVRELEISIKTPEIFPPIIRFPFFSETIVETVKSNSLAAHNV